MTLINVVALFFLARRIDMASLKSFRDDHLCEICRGEGIYMSLAEESGINPFAALDSLPNMLSISWIEPESFLVDLGNDNVRALIEVRCHFGLPPRG